MADDNKSSPTPAMMRRRKGKNDDEALMYQSGWDDGHRAGFAEGRSKGRQEIVDWLEEKYTGKGRPDRGTPEARAILELAREAALYMRGRQ